MTTEYLDELYAEIEQYKKALRFIVSHPSGVGANAPHVVARKALPSTG